MRAAEGVVVLEGAKLLRVARDAGVVVSEVFVAADAVLDDADARLVDYLADAGASVATLDGARLRRLLDTVTPQPLVGVATVPIAPPDLLAASSFVVVLAGVADPGNAGTLLRSAEAAGADAVVVTAGSVDVWSPKCVRSSAGTVLQVPILTGVDGADLGELLGGVGLHSFGTTLDAAVAYDSVDLTERVALVLGNEAHGLDAEVAAQLDSLVTIPMAGRAESLNVAMAGSVLCFEVLRQRRAAVGGTETDWTEPSDQRKG